MDRRPVTKKETEIQKEDQLKINEFSRLNQKCHEIEAEIKQKKEHMDALEDATYMIEESMGENLWLMIGECFIETDEEYASQHTQELMESDKQVLETITDDLDDIQSKMKLLKAQLYSKFGANIHLEEN